ncbi:hypothetical protein U9M48_020738 [Paspalum notatum var. saurae]|uniref:Uncharacterized protein n=1 Tax=Paspalum notatum var. saurae TaxID=547442 RepID=A0AAQ3TGU6_PASNO
MASAGGGDDTGGSGETPKRLGVYRNAAGVVFSGTDLVMYMSCCTCGGLSSLHFLKGNAFFLFTAAAGQNLGVESGNKKRKTTVMYKGSIGLVGNGDDLEVAFEDSCRIKKEIEDLRSQLDEDVKELGYCEENEKLRVELARKTQEMQCLRKQNEEMQARNDSIRKWNEELQAKNDRLAKLNEEPQAENDGLVKQNKKLQAKNDELMKWIEELEAKNDSMWKWTEKLESNNDDLTKQIEELEAKNDSLRKWAEELEAMNEGLLQLNEKLQAKNEALTNQNEDLQANNDDLNKLNRVLQAGNDSMTKQNEELQAKNDVMTKWNEELQAKNDGLRKNIMEILEIQIDAKRENLQQFLGLYRAMNFPIPQLKLSEEESSSELVYSSMTAKGGADAGSKTEDKSKLFLNLVFKDKLNGCTDIGAEVSWDTILESVQRLKQAERPRRLSRRMLLATYASELEHTRKKNEELESEKASAEQLMAMLQQVIPPIFNEFDLKIPVQEGTSLKSHIQSMERIAAKLKGLPGVIRQTTLELVKGSAAHCGSLVLAILKNQVPTLDVSVIDQGFRGTEKEAEDLAESLKHLVEPLSSTIEFGSSEITIHCHLV